MTGLVLAALSGGAGCRSSGPPANPSVILVTLDTTRADRLGVYGGHSVPTPNLDGVASEGVVFETAISNVPITLPAHASILTGRYPASHGVRHNGIYRLPEEVVTLAERLRDDGFATAAFIAAYVLNRGFGTEQGFETYDDIPVEQVPAGQDHALEAQRSADEVNAAVFRWLDSRREGRFFLWVHYYDPHIPYDPPEKAGRSLHGVGYDREIAYVDACFGDLVARLRSDGLLDRSILVVVGDHGESLGEHGEETHGLLLYEGAVHVPMFFRAPGRIPAGRRVSGPVELVDIAPTLLELLGLTVSDGIEGRSLLPRIGGKEDGSDRLAFAETLMGRLEYGWSELYMARGSRFKYVEAPTPELYDLERDPGESQNLAGGEPERVEETAASLRDWLTSIDKAGGSTQAARALSPDEEARLRSLGYLGGDAFKQGPGTAGKDRALPDPKSMIEEARRLSQARARLTAGDAIGALSDVDGILASNPRNHKARGARVEILCRLGRFTDAEEEAKAGISLARADVNVSGTEIEQSLGLLAVTYRRQNKLKDAEAAYREILQVSPASETAAVDLARMLADAGRAEDALKLTLEPLRRNPRNGMALAARFVAVTKLGRGEDALATALAIAEARSSDTGTLADAGDLLMKSRKPQLAAQCYRAARAQGAADPLVLLKLGTALLASGDLAEANEAFGEAARRNPQEPRAYYFLGYIALMEGNEPLARTQFGQALALDPAYTQPLVELGRWLAKNGRTAEAKAVLEDAIRRNPRDEKARKALESL